MKNPELGDNPSMERKDLSSALALLRAQEFIDIGYEVHFSYLCKQCGEKCILIEPNTLTENGECSSCGYEQPLDRVGFIAILHTHHGQL